jgi:type VI secretion system protein ImpB
MDNCSVKSIHRDNVRADSFQNEVPKARINPKLDLHTGGASKKTELPLKLRIAGDFSNGQESSPLSERKKLTWIKITFIPCFPNTPQK